MEEERDEKRLSLGTEEKNRLPPSRTTTILNVAISETIFGRYERTAALHRTLALSRFRPGPADTRRDVDTRERGYRRRRKRERT